MRSMGAVSILNHCLQKSWATSAADTTDTNAATDPHSATNPNSATHTNVATLVASIPSVRLQLAADV